MQDRPERLQLKHSNSEWGGKEPERQGDGEEDNFQHAVNGNADDAERQQEQPHEWIGDQSDERQGPANAEQEAPEEKCEHVRPSFACMILRSGNKESSAKNRIPPFGNREGWGTSEIPVFVVMR
jgi:hypothetical protein